MHGEKQKNPRAVEYVLKINICLDKAPFSRVKCYQHDEAEE